MFFKKTPPKNYLSLVPLRRVKDFSESEGKITLLIPKFKNEGLRKWLVPKHKSTHFKIHLDETGSHVWRLIDDCATVEEICDQLNKLLLSQGEIPDLLD